MYPNKKKATLSLENILILLKNMNFHTIGRISIFKDSFLAQTRPEWAARSEYGNLSSKWLNPSLPEVQQHQIYIIREAALRGLDEIQLDYLRFPYPGEITGGRYSSYSKNKFLISKEEVIIGFLKKIKEGLTGIPVLISADTFGITAWQAKKDIIAIGQDFAKMADHLDILSPMLYPSHFSPGFHDIKNPADEPEYFLMEGTKKMIALTGNKIPIRPWLQAFRMKVTNFNSEYIKRQIRTAKQAGGNGFLLWNSSNRYREFLTIHPNELKNSEK
jgi:hypothetical protein